jgi:FkbM family methyltransferase
MEDRLAAVLRALPPFRGKGRLGIALGRRIYGHPERNDHSLKTVAMRDGSVLQFDVRSSFEERAFWTGEYDRAVIALLGSILQTGDTVIDVGANIGFYAVPLGRRLKSLAGRLYAFEPIDANYQRLRHVLTLNGLAGVVTAVRSALADRSGEIAFHTQNEWGSITGNAVMIGSANPVRPCDVTVQVDTLDHYSATNDLQACRLIKLDVEGAELLVLRGARDFIEKHLPIICYEYNEYWAREFFYDHRAILEFAKPFSYETFQFAGPKLVSNIEPLQEVSNFLMLPPGTDGITRKTLGLG